MYNARYLANSHFLSHHEERGMLHNHIPDLQFLIKMITQFIRIAGLLNCDQLCLFCELRIDIKDGVFDGKGDMLIDEVIGMFLFKERNDFF
jgi:hypothetical protein